MVIYNYKISKKQQKIETKQKHLSKSVKEFCEILELVDFQMLLQNEIKANRACSITQYNGGCLKIN